MKLFITTSLFLFFVQAYGQFPEKWLGHYSGTMKLSNSGAPDDSLVVSLDILELHPDSAWTYSMVYSHPKHGKIKKNYLITRDANSQDFLMDEQNGILIQMSYMNDCFYEYYEVDGVIYSTTMRRIAGGIFFEVFGASKQTSMESDSEPDENKTVHKVKSMKPTFAQSVLLMPIE